MPIGQGGFHVGALRKLCWQDLISADFTAFEGAEVLYVYDCGSEPKRHVHREINRLTKSMDRLRIDVLVLSHFDRDHICGTPHLLRAKGGFEVDTILLPFVDAEERVVALAKAVAAAEEFGGAIDRFFVDMVFDPIAALSAFNPRRIIFVRPDQEDGVGGSGGEDGPRFEREGKASGDGEVSLHLKPAYSDRPMGTTNAHWLAGTHVMEVHNGALILEDSTKSIFWKLRPYVQEGDLAAISIFRREVEDLFEWERGSFAMKIALPAIRKLMVTKKRTKLAAAYRTAFGDKNLTSLCLYSGPADPQATDASGFDPWLVAHDLTKIGWLGTGDAHLKEAADIAAFEQALGADIDHTSTFVFPHHGSIKNSDPGRLITDADHWVASADPVHDWEHPHWTLRQAVSVAGRHFHHVRSPPQTLFRERFILQTRTPVPPPRP